MQNLSYENEFYSQVHSNANHTHFHMKDFALGLGLKQRQKATRKWPILVILNLNTVVQLFTSCRLELQLSLAIFLFRLASTVFSVLEVLVKHNLLCLTPSFPKQASNIRAVYVGIRKGYRLWSSAVRGC